MFELTFRPKALKGLGNIERESQLVLNAALNNLVANNFDLLDMQKIQGTKQGYRVRVGQWRVLVILDRINRCAKVVDIFLRKGKDDYKRRIHLLK